MTPRSPGEQRTAPRTPAAILIPAADRHHWANEWLTSWQSFPGTGNFDVFANAHGVLAMHNDDLIDAGEGLDAHRHQNMEIITWVVQGAVAHRDSHGHSEVLRAGTVGAMTAGRGITHSEHNAAARATQERLRVIQMWVPPHEDQLPPAHSTRDVVADLASGEPCVVVSGRAEHADSTALPIANRYAALHIARPRAGQSVAFPAAPFGHLFLTGGRAEACLDTPLGSPLGAGDALRLTDAGPVTVTVSTDAEILYWEMHASFDVPRPA